MLWSSNELNWKVLKNILCVNVDVDGEYTVFVPFEFVERAGAFSLLLIFNFVNALLCLSYLLPIIIDFDTVFVVGFLL